MTTLIIERAEVDETSAGWRRPFLWVFALGSLTVALGVLWQAFTIVAFVRGAGDQARDLHVLGAYVVHTVEIVVFLAALGAFWSDWKRVSIAFMFPVVGTVQVFAIGDTNAPGGWVSGLHGLLALVMLLWAAWFARVGARALRQASASLSSGVALEEVEDPRSDDLGELEVNGVARIVHDQPLR